MLTAGPASFEAGEEDLCRLQLSLRLITQLSAMIKMKSKRNTRSLMMLTGSMLIFGTIGIFRRFIPIESSLLASARGLMGAVFLAVFVKLRGGKIRHGLKGSIIARLALTGVAMGFNWILLFEAYNYTSVSIATLCYYMQPVIVVALSPLLFKEKLTLRKILCLAAAVCGMVLISSPGSSGGSIKGILFGLGAAVLYASVIILNKTVRDVDVYEKTIIQLLAAGAVMIPYLLISGLPEPVSMGVRGWIMLLVVGLVHTGLAYALYFGSMDDLEAQTIALLSYLDPLTALILSALILHEHLTLPGVIGAVLILGAAVVSENVSNVSKDVSVDE